MELEQTTCCACGIVFALPEARLQQLRETKTTFFCPNGHTLSFKGESTKEKIDRLVREKQQQFDRRVEAERKLERLQKRMKRQAKQH